MMEQPQGMAMPPAMMQQAPGQFPGVAQPPQPQPMNPQIMEALSGYTDQDLIMALDILEAMKGQQAQAQQAQQPPQGMGGY